MDPYTELQNLRKNMEKMTKTIEGIENDLLDTLRENTELKVENQLLREKLNKLNTKQVHENRTPSGMETLQQIYQSGYHICNMYYGSHRERGADCMFCLDILDNFGKKTGHK